MDVPEIVGRYFEAANRRDPDAVAACFAEDGMVGDEGEGHRGRAAIRDWNVSTTAKYDHSSELLGVEPAEGGVVATARVTGGFAGSPVTLRYVFELKDGLIRRLSIS